MSQLKEYLPLIRHHALKPVPETNVYRLGPDILYRTHGLMEKLTHPPSAYIALAHNQIPFTLLQSEDLPSIHFRILFLTTCTHEGIDTNNSDNSQSHGCLWINPSINSTRELICRDEGCGSLPADLSMFILRPKHSAISGYRWFPGEDRPSFEMLTIDEGTSATFAHELRHLDGFTAADDHPLDWRGSLRLFDHNHDMANLYLTLPDYVDISRRVNKNWLVTNQVTNRLEVIDSDGNFLGNFK